MKRYRKPRKPVVIFKFSKKKEKKNQILSTNCLEKSNK